MMSVGGQKGVDPKDLLGYNPGMLMHCETDELLATMLVKVVRQDGVNLETRSQPVIEILAAKRTHNAET